MNASKAYDNIKTRKCLSFKEDVIAKTTPCKQRRGSEYAANTQLINFLFMQADREGVP